MKTIPRRAPMSCHKAVHRNRSKKTLNRKYHSRCNRHKRQMTLTTAGSCRHGISSNLKNGLRASSGQVHKRARFKSRQLNIRKTPSDMMICAKIQTLRNRSQKIPRRQHRKNPTKTKTRTGRGIDFHSFQSANAAPENSARRFCFCNFVAAGKVPAWESRCGNSNR